MNKQTFIISSGFLVDVTTIVLTKAGFCNDMFQAIGNLILTLFLSEMG
jgi:hypothetical protein